MDNPPSPQMQSLIAELASTTSSALLVILYLLATVACIALFFLAGYYIGSPLGGLIVQLHQSLAIHEPIEPHRIPEASRRIGALFSFVFFLCGLVAEGAKLEHPESISFRDIGIWFLRAAIIGVEVTAAVSGLVLVAKKVRGWMRGELKTAKV